MTALAFTGLAGCGLGSSSRQPLTKISDGYGELIKDPLGLLDLPKGFSYGIISSFNQPMTDGLAVPDRADGMGCLPLDDDRVALIRNHELTPKHLKTQPAVYSITHVSTDAYDTFANGVALPGGTTNVIYNLKTRKVEQ